MPINNQNDISDMDIDAIIGSAELDEWRKKYAVTDSDSIDEEPDNTAATDAASVKGRKGFLKRKRSRAEENESREAADCGGSRQPAGSHAGDLPDNGSAPPVSETPDTGADNRFTDVTGSTETTQAAGAAALPEGSLFGDDGLEDLMSSFRVVYEESINKLDSYPTAPETAEAEIIPDPTESETAGQMQEPESVQATPEKPAAADDFLSGMRIIYEAPDDDIPANASADEKPAEPQAPELIAATPELSVASLFKQEEPAAAGLAELMTNADGNKPKEGSFKRFIKKVFPCKGDGTGEVIRKSILLLAVCTMLVCGVILLNIYIISPYLISRETQKAVDLKTNSNIAASWATAQDMFPGIEFPTGMQLKYAEFYAVNNDFAGWLEIPGLSIDMPIVKGDNNSEYLKKTFYGEKSKYGCCFIDSSNNLLQLDRNTVIYGHNMSYDDLMFGPLEAYKKIDGFKASPVIHFGTLYKDTKWKIYAVFITNGSSSGDNGYLFNYIFRNLSSGEVFRSYIAQVDQRKLYSTGVDIQPSDKILTLSTCIYDFKNARLAVVARQVRDGEDESVDVSKAAEISAPRYPQAWYSAKGLDNPYKNADKWMPN